VIQVDDASGITGYADRVCAPESAEEAARLLAEAMAARMAVTASGAGTGVTGGRVPQGGWLMSIEKLRRMEIGQGRATVGAGVLLQELQAAAAAAGQFYAPDPTEWSSSLGGNIATNASGSRSFRYGSTRRHLESVTAAFADGSVRRFERGELLDFPYTVVREPATTKNTAGYRLPPGATWMDLLVGSEGTLCLVTEAEVRLLPAPAEVLAGVVFFSSDSAALEAVDRWRRIEQLNMLEYVDDPSLGFLRAKYKEIPASAKAALMVEQELDGLEGDAVDAWLERMAEAEALEESWFGETAADRERFRVFRHTLPELVNDHVRRQGCQKLSSDFAVPVERNGAMLEWYQRTLGEEFPSKHTVYGHIGDAHVHVNILSAGPEDFERGKQWMERAARQAVELGGTVSAEHGLGKRKAHFLPLMYTGEEIEAMKAVKRRLDPLWLLGPGTLFA
jgi:FAD/FMN-containing dehydrogenase